MELSCKRSHPCMHSFPHTRTNPTAPFQVMMQFWYACVHVWMSCESPPYQTNKSVASFGGYYSDVSSSCVHVWMCARMDAMQEPTQRTCMHALSHLTSYSLGSAPKTCIRDPRICMTQAHTDDNTLAHVGLSAGNP